MVQRLEVKSQGERIAGVLHLPGEGRWPCVVASHGLLSTKESDKYLLLGRELPRQGIALFRFDFRGCGESGGTLQDSTVGGRVADLLAVVKTITAHPSVDGGIGLFGSSLGGYVSLFAASEDPRVKAVVTWAAPATLRGVLEKREQLQAQRLGEAWCHELRQGMFLDSPSGVRRVLVVHGDQDGLVPVPHARLLWEKAEEPKRLMIIPGADHSLAGPAHRTEALKITIEWFKMYL